MDAANATPMDAVKRRERLDLITGNVIGCAQKVSTTLGYGFVERVYESALVHELSKRSIAVGRQRVVDVWYDGVAIDHCILDLVVQDEVLVELKAVSRLLEAHRIQCLNYLKATGLSVCILLNFGNARLEYKRVVNNF